MRTDPVERFLNRFTVEDSGCWLWQGRLRRGYGGIKIDGFEHPAHRFSYELFVGPIPDELFIDHICNNRACVNPDHLQVVTCSENIRFSSRRDGTHRNTRKTHCPHGHEYDGSNTAFRPSGGRYCKTCNRERAREAYYS